MKRFGIWMATAFIAAGTLTPAMAQGPYGRRCPQGRQGVQAGRTQCRQQCPRQANGQCPRLNPPPAPQKK